MCQFYRAQFAVAGLAAVIGMALPTVVCAQEYYNYNQNYSNRYGVDLPAIPIPNGQDEIRAADGTHCKSTVASNGAYFDTGVIGSNTQGSFNAGGVYGRIVVPLGERPSRIDCRRLYELEIERLQMELQLAKMGLGGQRAQGANARQPEPAVQAAPVVAPTGTYIKAAPVKKIKPWTTEVVAANARSGSIAP